MYKFLLCLRYLKTRYIALASIISVMLGVATMIVVNSVMAGFSSEMRERIHGILADVVVEAHSLDGAPDAQQQMARARQAAGEHIEAMTATVEVYGMLSFQYAGGPWVTRPVTLVGIKPEEKAQVGPLTEYLASYNPVREGGRVVRPPLRSSDEPPNWKLTEAARKHRERWLGRPPWLEDAADAGLPPHPAAADAATSGSPADEPLHSMQSDKAGTTDESPAGGIDPHDDPFAGLEENGAGKSIAKSGDDAEAANGNNASPKFADAPDFSDPAELESGAGEESTEPLDARLYVGAGLVSFPYEDRRTGDVKTMRMVRPGDDVRISTVSVSQPEPKPVYFNATVVDLFKSGMSEYDSNLVFCNLDYLQEARGMLDPETGVRSITAIQIKLKDFQNADKVVERLKSVFPPSQFSVKTWEQKQGPLLAAVEIESAILNVLLFLIIAVAGFGILAIFFMIVVEKTRDIGILKALGASSRGVMSIYLSYGLGLGLVGSGVGVALGLLFVRYINVIEDWITWLTGREVFDETIYYFPEIPTAVHPMMVFWVSLGAVAIAVLASVLPARRAARLHPVEALRYE